MRERVCVRAASVLLPLILPLALLVSSSGLALAAPTPEQVDEARTLLHDGNAQLHAGRPAEALEKFERSLALVPSPNTELLVGRALRELGRKVEAARAFESAEVEAHRRVAAGETKYTPTENAAHTEGAQLRAQLGTLRIRVADARRSTLAIDGKPVGLAAEGDTAVFHEAGRAEIVVRRDETEQRQVVTVVAGTVAQMEFTAQGPVRSATLSPPAAATPVRTDQEPSRPAAWTTPAAIGAGAVAVVSAGVFGFFGLRMESTWDELSQRCGPTRCGPADRAEADRAMTDQTIANVGLVVGSVAAAAAITFLVIGLSSHDSPGAKSRASASLKPRAATLRP